MFSLRHLLTGLVGSLALAMAVTPGCGDRPEPLSNEPRAIVLISLDTLRPDRLGLYGNTGGSSEDAEGWNTHQEVSPVLDRLGAEEAVVFEQALSPAPWTLPAHMSMLTGLDPISHGVRHEGFGLSKNVRPLALLLQEQGFATGGFTDGGFVSGHFGFDRGFDVYEDTRNPAGQGPNGFTRLLPDALEWMEDHQQEDYFVFLHTFDIHAPYSEGDPDILDAFQGRNTPSGPDDHLLFSSQWAVQQNAMGVPSYRRMSELLNDYDAGVHEADQGVGQVIDVLKKTGRWDNCLFIVTSDHGESFYDHDLHVGHGLGLTDDELAIPLVIRFPEKEGAGKRVSTLVDLLDISATVLDILEIDPDSNMQGESLRQLIRGETRRRDYVFGLSSNTETMFLIRDGYKYITPVGIPPILIAQRHLGVTCPPLGKWANCHTYTVGDRTGEYDESTDPLGIKDNLFQPERLYLRQSDPNEKHNLADQQEKRLERMRDFLLEVHQGAEDVANHLFDKDADITESKHESHVLAELGYLGAGNRQDWKAMPKWKREAMGAPYASPPMQSLYKADRIVHEIRVRTLEGLPLPPNVHTMLQGAGDAYVTWWSEQPMAFNRRAIWRVLSLVDVAQTAEIPLDIKSWIDSGIELFQAQGIDR